MPAKGYKLSKKSIEQMKQSKLNKIMSKYNWIISEPYLDIKIKNGATNRLRQFITLREFKNNLENGLSIVEMQKNNISKTNLQFFSNFCQGKIKLTKNQFIEEYEKGFSLDEIC